MSRPDRGGEPEGNSLMDTDTKIKHIEDSSDAGDDSSEALQEAIKEHPELEGTYLAGEYKSATIRKIRDCPASINSLFKEGKNLFMVEAELQDVSRRLRPGMEGYGKVIIDQRKLIWIWTHKAVDWLRIWVWSWMP